MKTQWTLLIGLVFAIIIAIFAVVNVDSVPINYIFGEAHWPMVLVILGSAFIGAVISVSVVSFNLFSKMRQIKHFTKETELQNQQMAQLKQELVEHEEQLAQMAQSLQRKDERIQHLQQDLHVQIQQQSQLTHNEQGIIEVQEPQ